MTTSTRAAAPQTLLRYRPKDTPNGITRATVLAAAKALDITETQLVHQALVAFVSRIRPRYDADFDPLTRTDYAEIRRRAGTMPGDARLLSSIIDD